jgi:hypothetical protein
MTTRTKAAKCSRGNGSTGKALGRVARCPGWVAPAAGLALAWWSSPALAAVLNVPGTFPTIQSAINAAVDGDEIVVAPGTYTGLIDLGSKALTIRSSGAPGSVVLNGADDGPVVTSTGATGGTVRLTGLVIRDGLLQSGHGAGVRVTGSAVEIVDCTIESNETQDGGGAGISVESGSLTLTDCDLFSNFGFLVGSGTDVGVAVRSVSSSVTISGCVFEFNAGDQIGGVGVGASGDSTVIITSSTFDGNASDAAAAASGLGGAGVQVRDNTALTITDSTFLSGDTRFGGTAIKVNTGNTGPVNISGSTFSFNLGTATVSLAGVGTATFDNCDFTFNTADGNGGGSGGGISLGSGTHAIITNCLFQSNTASAGGGIAINGSTARVTVEDTQFLDNDSTGAGPIFGGGAAAAIVLSDADNVFRRCTFRGNVNTDDLAEGGAFRVRRSIVTFEDCVFEDNIATDKRGGAVHFTNESITRRTMTFRGCTFDGNQAIGTVPTAIVSGAAIDVIGSLDLVIEDCDFIANRVTPVQDGGDISGVGDYSLTIRGSTFTDSLGKNGGSLFLRGNLPVLIEDSTFTGAVAQINASGQNGDGGAINAGGTGGITIRRTSFLNCAGKRGGGLFIPGGGAVVLEDVLFDGCSATPAPASTSFGDGGGLLLENAFSVRLTNVIARNNTARQAGGLQVGGANSILTNVLAYANTATSGNSAGIRASGPIKLINCTIVDNIGEGLRYSSFSNASGSVVSSTIVRGNTLGQILGGTPTVRQSNIQGGFAGTGNIDANPLFVNAAGGDYSLSAGSPCIDAGNSTDVPVTVIADLAQNPRRANDPGTPDTGVGPAPVVDIGAFEFPGQACVADLTGDGQVDSGDLQVFVTEFLAGNAAVADLTGDGQVDSGDLAIFINAFLAGC